MILVHSLHSLIFLYSNGYLRYFQKITNCMSFCSLYSTYLPFTYLLNLPLPISQHQFFSLSHLKLHKWILTTKTTQTREIHLVSYTWTHTIKTTQTTQIHIVAYTWTHTTKTIQTIEIHVTEKVGPLQSSVHITLFADTLTDSCNTQCLHLHKQKRILLMWGSILWHSYWGLSSLPNPCQPFCVDFYYHINSAETCPHLPPLSLCARNSAGHQRRKHDQVWCLPLGSSGSGGTSSNGHWWFGTGIIHL